MGCDQDVVDLLAAVVVLDPRGEDADAVAHGGDHIGLVQRPSQPDQVAQVLSGPFAVPGEAIDRLRGFPGTGIGQPPRMGEVVVGDHGRDPVLPAGGRHPSIVLEGRARELALFRLDTAPLQREAVHGESESGQKRAMSSG